MVNGKKTIKFVDVHERDIQVPGKSERFWEQNPLLFDWPDFPAGDWNLAEMESRKGQLVIVPKSDILDRSTIPLDSIWHPNRVDYSDLCIEKQLLDIPGVTDKVAVVTHPCHVGRMAMKIEGFNTGQTRLLQGLTRETDVYRLIDGKEVAPEFLGHIMDGENCIGFLTDYIADTKPATKYSQKLCLETLEKFHHATKMLHCDLHVKNFLIHEQGTKAYLIDFESVIPLTAAESQDQTTRQAAFADNRDILKVHFTNAPDWFHENNRW